MKKQQNIQAIKDFAFTHAAQGVSYAELYEDPDGEMQGHAAIHDDAPGPLAFLTDWETIMVNTDDGYIEVTSQELGAMRPELYPDGDLTGNVIR